MLSGLYIISGQEYQSQALATAQNSLPAYGKLSEIQALATDHAHHGL